jgi:Restriction endonuclease/DnaJ domain
VGRDTYYEILGVSPTATQEEIKLRYRTVIRKIHPDLDVPAALFRQVQEAYEVLSVPDRRATYDHLLASGGGSVRKPLGDPSGRRPRDATFDPATRDRHPPGWGTPQRAPRPTARTRKNPGASSSPAFLQPPWPLAAMGALLILVGTAFADPGTVFVLLGSVTLLIAGVVGLGVRGEKERAAYRRSGMTAIDAMTSRQFEVLLKNLFASKGYWVARIGGRSELGADLLLNDGRGRTIVQTRRRHGVVDQEAVEQAVAAMTRYRVERGLVVTPSDYSQQAVAAANSNGVTLWNRADLAAELTTFRSQPLRSGARRFSSELRAGSRICLGFLVAVFVTLVTVTERARRTAPAGQEP